MNTYHRSHRRIIAKRQGLDGVLGGLVSGSSTSGSTSSAASQTTDGGIIAELSSFFGGGTTAHPSTSTSPLTQTSSSPTGSTTASHSATSTSKFAPSTAPASTTSASTPTAPVVFTSSDGTSVVYVTSIPPTASATNSAHPSFLENPSLEGGVFTLVGVVVLIIIFLLASWTIRKRRRDRMEREFAAAVSFDPGATALYDRQEETMEKRRLSVSSSGHNHGYGPGYSMPQMAYTPQPEYHPQSYGQYPAVSYCPPPIPYQVPPPPVPQPVGQGGANLTRKFSDRKPVPPVFPDPAHDPGNPPAHLPYLS